MNSQIKREWKWSKGENYEKSGKRPKDVEMNDQNVVNVCLNQEPIYEIPNQGNNQVIDISKIPKGFIHKENKLNGQNEKLSSRHMIVQKGINPFVNTENYVDHLNTETSFLRPKNSNFSKE